MQAFPIVYREQITQEVAQTPDEYLPRLLQIVRSFRQGWRKVRSDETLPISELWTGIDAQ